MDYPMYMIIFFLILFTIIFYASSSSKIAERKMTMIIISKDKTKCAEYNRIIIGKAYGGFSSPYLGNNDAVTCI